MNIYTLIGFIYGFDLGLIVLLVYILRQIKRNHELNAQGQKYIDRLVAKKQVDFWYNETIKTFLGAAEAHSFGSQDLLNQYAEQHQLAVRRFEEARLNLLAMENK